MGERLLNILNKPCRAGAGCFLRPTLLFGFLALPPAVANAQTALPPASLPPTIAPSQVTPGASRQGSFAIPAVSALRLDVAAAPLEAPREARNLTVSLREVVIDGAFAELAMAHAAFRQEVVGKRISLAQVYDAAGRLEAAYARAGFVLVRVVIPPQTIEQDGELRIEIVDGTIEAIDSDGVPSKVRGFVRAHLLPLVGRPHLGLTELDQRLTLAGSAAGLELRSALKAGLGPGTTRLVIEGKLTRTSGSLSWDNSLPGSLGGDMMLASITINNLAGRGERIQLVTGQSSKLPKVGLSQNPYSLFGASLNLPLGNSGVSLEAGYLRSRTLQTASESFLNSLGHFARFGTTLTTASIAGHDRALFLSLGVDTITQHQELPFFSYQLNRDHYTSLRLGAAGWRRFADGSYVAGELLLSRSVAGRAVPAASEPPFSEPNARPGSSKLNGRFSWHVNLDAKTSLALTMRGQSSFGKPLFVPETLSLAAADGISAASPGSLITDSGITLRKELAREISLRLGTKTIAVSPYLFSAVAIGWNAKTSSNPSNLDVQALGFGTRWLHKAGSTQVRFAVEYGWCQCTAVNGAGSSRINLSIGLGF